MADQKHSGVMAENGGIAWRIVEHPAPRTVRADVGKDFRYQELLQCIFDAVLFTNLDGRILDVNPAAEAHFAARADQLRGAPVADLVAGADSTLIGAIVRQADRQHSVAFDAVCLRENGETFPGEVIVSRLQHHGSDVLLFCVSDVTARVRAEKELAEAVRNLGEAMREHSRIQSALSALYEVNNPLQVIMSMAEVDRNEEYRRQVTRIMEAVHCIRAGKPAASNGADVFSATADSERSEAGKPRAILIGDDDADVRRVFVSMLSRTIPDLRIDEAANGREAIASFVQNRQSLVILDVVMPEMTGEEVFGAIRKHCEAQGWAMPPCVFCTGYQITPSLRALIGDGSIHTCLSKPLSIGELVRAVIERMPKESFQ